MRRSAGRIVPPPRAEVLLPSPSNTPTTNSAVRSSGRRICARGSPRSPSMRRAINLPAHALDGAFAGELVERVLHAPPRRAPEPERALHVAQAHRILALAH